ncbi:MAG TPA: 3'-5' exonuclease [Ignavibacteria bacterium]|nr:3'-5' exonuclease [Ignavibacteria bacterium]HMR39335.1 3'-5' exonuclease [Ignavibacteria bacterium]
MELTDEQDEIINSSGNIKINAVAGSGKTTTIIEYAKARPKNSRILYLAFNKSVKNEAIKKFADKGLDNVSVETAHSLAYRNIVYGSKYTLRSFGYKSHEIAEMLKLRGLGEKHGEHIVASHISKFISYFCNSDRQKVSDLDYCDIVSDPLAQMFVSKHYEYIENQTRLFLAKMNRGEIEITHDFYLKKFQLSEPVLNYDYILFDEGQDASAAMLDIFFKQNAVKVIVGDTHQQIYGWRFAVNSLEKADFKTYRLTRSFRFGQDIADLAMKVLKMKEIISEYSPIPITGNNISSSLKISAILGRTNLGLLLRAIEFVNEKKNLKSLYFEGNINSYTYADEGASLYDVLNLYNGRHKMIRDKLVKQMKDLKELQSFIEKTGDTQFSMLVDIVKKYGNDIPKIIRLIKDKHVENDEKDKAEIIFSTVHRCKGMEYDVVEIINDFITEEKLEKQAEDGKSDELSIAKLNEEINLLYVAVTRTKNIVLIPETLVSKDFPSSPNIRLLKNEPKKYYKDNFNFNNSGNNKRVSDKKTKDKVYTVEGVRKNHKAAYRPWTEKLDEELKELYFKKKDLKSLAKHFGRTSGSIKARLMKLEVEEFFD